MATKIGRQAKHFRRTPETFTASNVEAHVMSYVRRKTVAGCTYIYEVAKVKRGRTWVEEIVRYIGPEDPIYGGRGPANLEEERARLAERRRTRASGA